MQIIVLSMHRSGSSVLTRLINMMGAYFGPEKIGLGFSVDNPKGYWERQDVVAINNELLKRHGAAWNQLVRWDVTTQPLLKWPNLSLQIQGLILDMDAHRPWVVKDPRMCLTLSYWKQYYEIPCIVVMSRDPLEVAHSLHKREQTLHKGEKYPIPFGLALWEKYNIELLNHSLDVPRIYVQHSELMADPVRTVARIHAELRNHGVQGLRLPGTREITAFIDPGLYRARSTAASESTLAEEHRTLLRILRGEEEQRDVLKISETCQRALEEFSPTPSAAPV